MMSPVHSQRHRFMTSLQQPLRNYCRFLHKVLEGLLTLCFRTVNTTTTLCFRAVDTPTLPRSGWQICGNCAPWFWWQRSYSRYGWQGCRNCAPWFWWQSRCSRLWLAPLEGREDKKKREYDVTV